MPDAPDYRSEKMDSAEGKGVARARVEAFEAQQRRERADAWDAATSLLNPVSVLPPELQRHFSERAKERAELIGFWVAWHLAGGFENLESGGWHRATLYRKIRRFRAEFGKHPDEYEFDWLKLDVERAWWDDFLELLGHGPDEG